MGMTGKLGGPFANLVAQRFDCALAPRRRVLPTPEHVTPPTHTPATQHCFAFADGGTFSIAPQPCAARFAASGDSSEKAARAIAKMTTVLGVTIPSIPRVNYERIADQCVRSGDYLPFVTAVEAFIAWGKSATLTLLDGGAQPIGIATWLEKISAQTKKKFAA